MTALKSDMIQIVAAVLTVITVIVVAVVILIPGSASHRVTRLALPGRRRPSAIPR